MAQHGPETGLRDFLPTRRACITPEQAGLPPHPGVRRVPGLRREEVARLAGVSVDYYVRLERGRSVRASASVLEAVARALQLNDTERDHMFALAAPTSRQPRPTATERARPGLMRALENVTEVPALLLGRRLDVLATNRLARVLPGPTAWLPQCPAVDCPPAGAPSRSLGAAPGVRPRPSGGTWEWLGWCAGTLQPAGSFRRSAEGEPGSAV
nr:helix-turn-helix transcriptional regulator [Streptomyces griseochromogenes]